MKINRIGIILAGLIVAVLLAPSCTEVVTKEEDITEGGEIVSLEQANAGPSEEDSQLIALKYLLNSQTFRGRAGIRDSIQLLSTTVLEKPFSWRFEYEFQCELPGYGKTTEPTPKALTAHMAEIEVSERIVTSALIDDEWDMLKQTDEWDMQTIVDTSTQSGNWVRVDFLTNWVHPVDGDSFTNAAVTGQRQWRISEIDNIPDETGEPVTGLRAILDSDMTFDWVDQFSFPSRPGELVKMGPPTYEWFFGDVPEGLQPGVAYDASVGFLQHTSTKITPGFDLSRSFNKTVFTTPDTQILTVTVTPRGDSVNRVSIQLSIPDSDLVDAMFTSITGQESAVIGPDSRCAEINNIPVARDIPISVTITIKVNPEVPEVEYKPAVWASAPVPIQVVEGSTLGSSFSYTDEAGTWTVSAEGEYVWYWIAHPSRCDYSVALQPKAE